jgi:hypothetical protein
VTDPYLAWPAEVSIETYTKCNASCSFCPYVTLERIGTKMPDSMIDRIIEELKHHPGEFVISPFKVNEPLLDRRVLPLLRRINAELPNAIIRLFTNGSTLTERNIRQVAALDRVEHLWISLNDHDPVSYHALMGLDFEHTTANLDRLHAIGKAGDFPHEVVVSKVRESSGRDEEFCAFVGKRWPYFRVHLIKLDGWINFTDADTSLVPDRPCGRWYELSIMSTGRVALCCMAGDEEHVIGDLNRQTLYEVYNQLPQRVRRMGISRRATTAPCNGCSY